MEYISFVFFKRECDFITYPSMLMIYEGNSFMTCDLIETNILLSSFGYLKAYQMLLQSSYMCIHLFLFTCFIYSCPFRCLMQREIDKKKGRDIKWQKVHISNMHIFRRNSLSMFGISFVETNPSSICLMFVLIYTRAFQLSLIIIW
jgi:hypothetical protein